MKDELKYSQLEPLLCPVVAWSNNRLTRWPCNIVVSIIHLGQLCELQRMRDNMLSAVLAQA